MTDKEFDSYVEGRYKNIMKWYDDRAKINKSWYGFFSIYVLIASVAVAPIMNLVPEMTIGQFKFDGTFIASILSPTVALAIALLSLFRCYGNWLSYRSTWDSLGHEIHWYNASCGEYRNAEDKKSLFVERVENLITSEGLDWCSRHKSDHISGRNPAKTSSQ